MNTGNSVLSVFFISLQTQNGKTSWNNERNTFQNTAGR